LQIGCLLGGGSYHDCLSHCVRLGRSDVPGGSTGSKEYVRFDYVHGDEMGRSAIIYPPSLLLPVYFAGMFGIGGGIYYCSIMLALGVHPSVVRCDVFRHDFVYEFLVVARPYIVFGLLLEDYAAAGEAFTVGFFAAMLGPKLMKQARQTKSASGRSYEQFLHCLCYWRCGDGVRAHDDPVCVHDCWW
jgi:hypothetical protein